MGSLNPSSRLPPGTVRLEDVQGKKIILSPQPSSDPNQPLNWSTWRKTIHMAILCFYGLMVYAILDISTPTWAQVNKELNLSYDDLNNSLAAGQATLATGCIFFVPIALKYGRRPVYIITAVIEMVSAIWFARMKTRADLFGANVLVGLAGAVNETLFQLTVADLFYVHQRATMNAVFLIMVLLGAWLSPVVGGCITDAQGWRWTWWYCAIFMALSTLTVIFGLEESKYTPYLAQDGGRTITNVEATGPNSKNAIELFTDLSSAVDETTALSPRSYVRRVQIDKTIPMKSYWQRHAPYTLDSKHDDPKNFVQHFYQPFLILAQFPAVAFAAIQWGWLGSMIIVLSVVQAFLYPQPPYNFSATGVGLQNLPTAIGSLIGCIFGGPLNDSFILQVAKRRKGIYEPESRLTLFLIPGFAMVVGVLTFGLTITAGSPWITNAVGACFVGFSIGACGDMVLTYVQDSYQDILGDALVGIVFVRQGLAVGVTFAVPPLLKLGGNTMFAILGSLSAAVALTCVPLLIWGRSWRFRLAGKYKVYAEMQY